MLLLQQRLRQELLLLVLGELKLEEVAGVEGVVAMVYLKALQSYLKQQQ